MSPSLVRNIRWKVKKLAVFGQRRYQDKLDLILRVATRHTKDSKPLCAGTLMSGNHQISARSVATAKQRLEERR
jgi:hypothetical protein